MFANDITSPYNLYLILSISIISQARAVYSSSGQMKCIFLLRNAYFLFILYSTLLYLISIKIILICLVTYVDRFLLKHKCKITKNLWKIYQLYFGSTCWPRCMGTIYYTYCLSKRIVRLVEQKKIVCTISNINSVEETKIITISSFSIKIDIILFTLT